MLPSSKLQAISPSLPILSSSNYQVPISGFQLSRIRCRVHPSVIMTMLYAHNRLSETHGFAIGTLLGTVAADGTKGSGVLVEIVDCFANPFYIDRTTSAMTIQKESHEWMLKLREKVNPKLSVVGWCCTTNSISMTTAVSDWAQSEQKISRFQPSKTLSEPVHLLIDPTFQNSKNIMDATKAYVRGSLRELFHDVQLEISLHPADLPGTAAIIRMSSQSGVAGPVSTSLDASKNTLAAALKNLRVVVTYGLKYTQAVLNNQIDGDPVIGRQLMRALCYETLLPKQEIEAILQGAVEDNLMVACLLNLARLQFVVAEKLNNSFL